MGKELTIFFAIVALALLAYFTLSPIPSETRLIPINVSKEIYISNITRRIVELKVPAVDNEGRGVATNLIVELKPGEGRVLVDVNQLLFWVDTQYSIRVAKTVAQNLTKIDLSKFDLIYAIETNASIIGGPSAGAALTVATVALLENKSLNPEVMITGSINPDGSIGQVGEIIAKAKASKDVGAKIFLVPQGQGIQINYKPVKECKKIGPITYCSIEYEEERIDVGKEIEIEVREVSNIQDALKYFLI
jgi:uncharacterized protein